MHKPVNFRKILTHYVREIAEEPLDGKEERTTDVTIVFLSEKSIVVKNQKFKYL